MKSKLFILAFLLTLSAFSQERKILGRIVDPETQKPIQNANVVIHGTSLAVSSNKLGFFELSFDPSKHKTLVISHIGFKTSTLDMPAEGRFKFSLEKEYILLSQLDLSLYPRGQTNVFSAEQPQAKKSSHLVVVESGSSYPNGIANFYELMGNSLGSLPLPIGENGVKVTFTINESGQAVNIVVSDSTVSIKNAVVQSFEKMPPWTPAMQGLNRVPQHFTLPVVRLKTETLESLDILNLYSYLSQNINYPFQALRMGIEGVVFVEFQVDKSGVIHDTGLLKDIGADCGDEVKRVIGKLPADLAQALCRYTNSTKFVLPVCFGLNGPFKALGYKPSSDGHLLAQANVVTTSREKNSEFQNRIPIGTTPKTDTTFFYHGNGNLKTKGRNVGKARFGIWTNYYENGKIKDKIVFDGDFIAAIESYDEAGKPKMINGTGDWVTKYFDALTRSEVTVKGSYKDTLRHGTWSYFEKSLLKGDKEERLVCTEVYNDGKFVKGKYYWLGGGIEDLKSPVYNILPKSTVFEPVDKREWEKTPVRWYVDDEFDSEHFPHFPGGMEKFLSYVKREFRCSSSNEKIFVEFMVDATGYIKKESIQIIKGDLGAVCAERLLKVLENSPKWKPWRQLGKDVSFRMMLPIKLG